MAKVKLWIGAEGEYLGSTGATSAEEFAHAIATSEDLSFMDFLFEDLDALNDVALEPVILKRLRELGIRGEAIPRTMFHDDHWDNSLVFPIPESEWADPVAVGLIKVLGVSN